MTVNTYVVDRINRNRAEVTIDDKNCKRLPLFIVERDSNGVAKVLLSSTCNDLATSAYAYMKACCEAIQQVI